VYSEMYRIKYVIVITRMFKISDRCVRFQLV